MKTSNVSKLKTLVIVILSAALAFSVVRIVGYNRIIQNTNSILDYIELQNDNLNKDIADLQSKYMVKEKEYAKLDSLLDNKNKQLDRLKLENRDLQLKLANLENVMANIPSDSSYNYLMHRYIPTQDSLPYGFAPNQVKAIHYDVIAYDYTKVLNSNVDSLNRVLNSLYKTSTLKFKTCADQNSILLEQQSLQNEKIANLEATNNIYKKQIKKELVKSSAFGIGVAGVLTYIVVKSIINK